MRCPGCGGILTEAPDSSLSCRLCWHRYKLVDAGLVRAGWWLPDDLKAELEAKGYDPEST